MVSLTEQPLVSYTLSPKTPNPDTPEPQTLNQTFPEFQEVLETREKALESPQNVPRGSLPLSSRRPTQEMITSQLRLLGFRGLGFRV